MSIIKGFITCCKKHKYVWLCLMGCLTVLPGFKLDASNQLLYSVKAVIPENQVDKKQTYFDLRLNPEEKQTVQVIVTNSNNEDIIAHIELNPATTGRNGNISYLNPENNDASLETSIVDIAAVKETDVLIPANDSRTIDIDIEMGKERFDGVILGGIAVSASRVEEEEKAENAGISIQNVLTYIIGLQISQTDRPVEPDFHLLSFETGLTNYKPSLTVNIQNDQPLVVKNMNVQGQVFQKGSQEVYRELILRDAEMAPQSNGNFVIDWASTPFVPGDYRLYFQIELNGQIWEWDEDFKISAEEANVNNEGSVVNDESSGFSWLWILIILLSIVILILAYLLGKRSRKNEDTGNRKN